LLPDLLLFLGPRPHDVRSAKGGQISKMDFSISKNPILSSLDGEGRCNPATTKSS
jgi:hypothetical protein